MPSTLVHVALAGLLACALLGEAFSSRTLVVVLGAVVLVDLDVFLGLFVLGAHRSAFHTLLWPALGSVAVAYDARRERSVLGRRYGPRAVRVAWVTIAAVVLAGIAPDAATNGANLLYPVHDQFYSLNGDLRLSTTRGIVGTFFESAARGSSAETQYYTGVDPDPARSGADVATPERTFLVVGSGIQAVIVLAGALAVAVNLHDATDSQ